MGIPLKLIKIIATKGLEAWEGGEWPNTYIPLTYLAKKAGGPTKLLKTLMKTSGIVGLVVGGVTTLGIKELHENRNKIKKKIKKYSKTFR